jgi:hypothetical protein
MVCISRNKAIPKNYSLSENHCRRKNYSYARTKSNRNIMYERKLTGNLPKHYKQERIGPEKLFVNTDFKQAEKLFASEK